MSISFQASLRTDKTTPGLGNTAASLRNLGYATLCEIPETLIDQYGRPTSLYGGLTLLGTGTNAGCYSANNRIQVENYLRPQYGEYLNVPQGLGEIVTNYANKPHYDTLGVNRSRFFGLDGSYNTMAPPPLNASSDSDWLKSQAYEQMLTNRLFENRAFTNSPDVMKSGMY
jgi:hypothetical protein